MSARCGMDRSTILALERRHLTERGIEFARSKTASRPRLTDPQRGLPLSRPPGQKRLRAARTQRRHGHCRVYRRLPKIARPAAADAEIVTIGVDPRQPSRGERHAVPVDGDPWHGREERLPAKRQQLRTPITASLQEEDHQHPVSGLDEPDLADPSSLVRW
jgi:hypothetical protein